MIILSLEWFQHRYIFYHLPDETMSTSSPKIIAHASNSSNKANDSL